MKSALITGIAGFVGSHLAEYLLSENVKVAGFYHPEHSTDNIAAIKKNLQLFSVNILKASEVKKALNAINPDYVFHLAASSSPAQSFQEPVQTLENNVIGQINLLDSLKNAKSKAKILIVGSAEEYGQVEEKDLPLKEDAPLMPVSPYAVSKVAQDFLGLQYFLHDGLNVVMVRPFNHIGPRQSAAFVVPALASQIASIEKNGGGEIKVGNLDSFRDFTDVRDIAAAYKLALDKGEIGQVYNIGSGEPVKIKNVLKILLSMSKVNIRVTIDKKRFAAIEIKSFYADYSKFHAKTGWKPRIPLHTTLFDTIEFERSKV